jgi:hypothetical protein
MLITRIFNICNNDSSTMLLVSKLLSKWAEEDVCNLFTQLENNDIIGHKLFIIWYNECNENYNLLLSLDYSKFNDYYFINKQLEKLTI